ncbi:malonate decarboxylase holo-[acyl-carrier-protein] synthase [Lentisphaerota bacterium ZTH]|nr:malonate decarboxylase holo-[acyl-carrier-protein] synthase [Lentisphaerota bacterium]WET05377.1 malonate decarboxylase holo-[acyl-carrier-protein] synthase [Lentisphaerota bacterium ZTH]
MPLSTHKIKRHQLVYLKPECAAATRSLSSCPSCKSLLKKWFASGHPAIIRRPCRNAHNVCLGVPLPPSQDKLRLAFEVPFFHIDKITPPPLLTDCLNALPDNQGKELKQLLTFGLRVRTTGSTAWQTLTGLQYLTTKSDVDLLLEVSSKSEFETADAVLSAWVHNVSHKYDIEMQLPDGSGFLWKEYQQKPKQVMLKKNSGAVLVSRCSLQQLLI